MRRMSLVLAAMALPVAILGLSSSGPVWAKAKAEKSITCKSFQGTETGTVTLSSCNGNTGGSSQPLSATALATGGTLKWTNGKTTTVGSPNIVTVTNKKCSAAGESADTVTIPVTADTTGLTSLGSLTTEVCIANGNISGLKPVKIT